MGLKDVKQRAAGIASGLMSKMASRASSGDGSVGRQQSLSISSKKSKIDRALGPRQGGSSSKEGQRGAPRLQQRRRSSFALEHGGGAIAPAGNPSQGTGRPESSSAARDQGGGVIVVAQPVPYKELFKTLLWFTGVAFIMATASMPVHFGLSRLPWGDEEANVGLMVTALTRLFQVCCCAGVAVAYVRAIGWSRVKHAIALAFLPIQVVFTAVWLAVGLLGESQTYFKYYLDGVVVEGLMAHTAQVVLAPFALRRQCRQQKKQRIKRSRR